MEERDIRRLVDPNADPRAFKKIKTCGKSTGRLERGKNVKNKQRRYGKKYIAVPKMKGKEGEKNHDRTKKGERA